MQFRRAIPRQPVEWSGIFGYLFEGNPDECWRTCRVFDISSAGSGLELRNTTPEGEWSTDNSFGGDVRQSTKHHNFPGTMCEWASSSPPSPTRLSDTSSWSELWEAVRSLVTDQSDPTR